MAAKSKKMLAVSSLLLIMRLKLCTVCMCALRIDSVDKILCFINTLIIIIDSLPGAHKHGRTGMAINV